MLDDTCANANHVAPATGGACPCGLVTRVPAPPAAAEENPTVRDLVARCLVERGGLADLPGLRQRADRVLRALAEAGLVVAPVPTAEPVTGRASA